MLCPRLWVVSTRALTGVLMGVLMGGLSGLFTIGTAGTAHAGMIRDTEIESVIERMIIPLEIAAGYAPGTLKVRVILNNNVNAFVRSGQVIYVHSGLLINGSGALQLLGVMAHEIGHLKAGHVQRIDEDITQAGTAAALATLAAIGAAASGHGDAAAGLLLGGNDRANRNLLSSVRRNEAVADEIGLSLLDDAGISSIGLRDMMAQLSRQRALPESRQSEYYSTHPGAAQRLQTYQDHVNTSPYSQTPLPPDLIEDFARIRAKIYAWTERPQTVLAQTIPELDPELGPELGPTVQTYAHAIAAYRRGALADALTRMDKLLTDHPTDAFFHEFRGDILLSQAQPALAADAYEAALSLRPQSPQIQLLLGRSLIAIGDKARLGRAIEVISSARDAEPSWAFLHRQLGIAYGKAGRISDADISLAEEAILIGDDARAVQLAKRTIARDGVQETLRNRANDIIFRYETKK